MEENKVVENNEAEVKPVKDEVAKKIKKQIEKKREKEEGHSRILEYLATEHKWENYLFLVVSIITLMLGILILTDVLVDVFAWILVAVAGLGVLYALYPFFKPAFPEFKKITWLKPMKFLGDAIRVFLFLFIFVALFLLYDAFITQIISRILK